MLLEGHPDSFVGEQIPPETCSSDFPNQIEQQGDCRTAHLNARVRMWLLLQQRMTPHQPLLRLFRADLAAESLQLVSSSRQTCCS